MSITQDTQVALLLTAPLLLPGRTSSSREVSGGALSPSKYVAVTKQLRQLGAAPADLLSGQQPSLCREMAQSLNGLDANRLIQLLSRVHLLSQVADRWESMGMWIVSPSDEGYPSRLTERLGDNAPPVLYGVGDRALLGLGGLAVVGSRKTTHELLEYAAKQGELAGAAQVNLISGSAKGVDQAAMNGAMAVGGAACGVQADSLERVALLPAHREYISSERLVLVSPYDPIASFNVGNAMDRNKLIYALADAALVVTCEEKKGGTWDGALKALRAINRTGSIYVQTSVDVSRGNEMLLREGALKWPDPTAKEELLHLLSEPRAANPVNQVVESKNTIQTRPMSMVFTSSDSIDRIPSPTVNAAESPTKPDGASPHDPGSLGTIDNGDSSNLVLPADQLWTFLEPLLGQILENGTRAQDVSDVLGVELKQAAAWLERLVGQGSARKMSGKPVRYIRTSNTLL